MSNVKRYSLPIVLGAISLALLIAGILALTAWRPAQEVVASREPEEPFIMSRAGVFPLYADEVTIRATGDPDQTVWLAVGSAEDISAWLQEESYEEITGLVGDLHTLKVVPHVVDRADDAQSADEEAAEAADEEPADEEAAEEDAQSGPQDLVNPISSDMWTHVKYGRGSVSITLTGTEMDMSILAATDGTGPAPTVTMTWKTPQSNLLAVVSFAAAAVVALIAVVIALVLWRSRKKRLARSEHLRGAEERATVDTTQLTAISDLEGQPLPKRARKAKKPKDAADVVLDQPAKADDDQGGERASRGEPEGTSAPVRPDRDFAPDSDEALAETAQEEAAWQSAHPGEPESADEEFAFESDIDLDTVSETGEIQAEEQLQESALAEDSGSIPSPGEDVETVEAVEVEESWAPDEEPSEEVSQRPALQPARSETVTTDSGMMNLSALQGGGTFPTRRALRDARRRGVNNLVVGERSFTTATSKTGGEDPVEALKERSAGAETWSEAMEGKQ